MKRFKSLSLAVIAMGAAALTITSCNIEEGGRSGKSGRVMIDVSTDSGIDTKVARSEEYETVDLSVDGLPFFLSMTKSAYKTNSSVQTKGAIIFDDRNLDKNGVKNINERGSFDFYARNWGDKSLYPSIDGITDSNTASYNGGRWDIDHQVDFPESGKLDFWAYSYEGTKPYSLISHNKFSYTGVIPAGNKNDGSLMSDFLVANTSEQTAENNPVNIHFYHALAAVKFNVAPAYLTDEVTGGPYSYLSVRISEVKNSGSATFDGKGAFTWTTDDAKVVYEQVLYDGTMASDADRTMFFVPQDAKGVLLFTFYLTNNEGQEYALSTKSIGAAKFDAGYIYTYTIGNDVTGNVEVEVHESFDGETKTATVGLQASASAYVRVAIVANWFTDAAEGKPSKAYAEYDPKDIETSENWLYSDPKNGGDGYYYYKYPLLGYTDSSELVKDFKCTGAEPESPFNLHLEMKIIAQAVMAKQVGDDKFYNAAWVWGSDFGKDIRSEIITVAQ